MKRFYERTSPPPNGGPPRTERSPLPCGHLPTPWGVTLFKGALFTSLQTPYKIKLTACTRKHLNINVTNTGKGNNRRWQAPGGQRGQRANSAGRFRCGCPRKLLSSGKSAGRCGHRPLHVPRDFSVKSNTLRKGFPQQHCPCFT